MNNFSSVAFYNITKEKIKDLNLNLLYFLQLYFKAKLWTQKETKWYQKVTQKIMSHNRGKIRLMSWKFYADLLSPALTISRCFISGKSDLYHCLLSNAGALPQLVKTACLNLHTSDRITALAVLVCWQQFILMRCHNMEFFNALHHGASKSHYTFSTARCYRFSKKRKQVLSYF